MPEPRKDQRAWLAHLTEIGRGHGFFERIASRHTGLYVQEGDTLLISFDEAGRVLNRAEDQLPLGFAAATSREWSVLNVMAFGATWFRDADLYAFFDQLIDEDFFDSFERIVVMGAGPMCGHAAAAFSVAAPEATVIALAPVASPAAADAPFETRFPAARRMNFADRYGYAPDMVGNAEAAFIVYDPYARADAAQAALFRGGPVQHLPLPFAGSDPLGAMERADTFDWMVKATDNGRLANRWPQIARKTRRQDPISLRRMMTQAQASGHPRLAQMVARHGADTTGDAAFRTALAQTEAA